MFEPILATAARSYFFMRRFMPTAIVIDTINTRRGLKWGVLAMLLAVPYALAAIYCRAQVEAGAPAWLNLIVILCLWNTLKLLLIGPISLLKLMAARVREAVARRRMTKALHASAASTSRCSCRDTADATSQPVHLLIAA
ncbi:sulfate permease [Cryobacterium sp. TMS1-13-1]|uniref:sulfate permease n=1 Tax=Cryobacterium sp. TMS1-13-1 TaxID=1259220 RepID=UPI0015815687|nr:sulfate permease [Cryobacterium sp. TMS1-13-1]